MIWRFTAAWLVIQFLWINANAEKITYTSKDGVKITAESYKVHLDTVPLIILFHQAGWSRGEYLEIAPRLNRMGFNCLAVDLRSGSIVNNIQNETFLDAKRKMKDTNYMAAELDVLATIKFALNWTKGDIILWGSSYSASLVLRTASLDSTRIKAVISFSPGEYFRAYGKPADFIAKNAGNIKVPTFIASSNSEQNMCRPIFEAIPIDNKTYFIPESSGHHGSSALWNIHFDSKAYWISLEKFLESL